MDHDDDRDADPQPFRETAWTPAAREAYRSGAEALVRRLQEHADLTSGRRGRQSESSSYSASVEEVRRALDDFAEAESAWCGSAPVAVDAPLDDDDAVVEPAGDPSLEEAAVVSVLGRWDHVVTDAAALVDHARRSYLQAWPDDTSEDAEVRISSVEMAFLEILHGAPLRQLDGSPGVEPLMSTVELVRHPGTDEEEFLESPFTVRDG